MSALSELQPYLDSYPEKIRRAKNASGYTLQELSDLSGVPYNNICDVNSGRVKQPLLFYAAATCKVLGLSLNALVGIDEPTGSRESDKKRIHELELENVRKDGEIQGLSEFRAQAARYARVIYLLLGVCVLLLVAVIGYVAWDINMTTAGLFQSTGTSVLAVFLGLALLAAVASIAYAVRSIHRGGKQ